MTRGKHARTITAAALALTLTACAGRGDSDVDTAAAGNTATAAPVGATGAATGAASGAGSTTGAQAQPAGTLLDPNTATREQLLAVPGMAAHAADAIVAGRPYADMVALDRALASHVTDSTARRALYAHVWKPIDINKASGAEILLIPGVGPRMRREFEEYRPYRNVEQFRREIGKYVDQGEIARLERYIAIR